MELRIVVRLGFDRCRRRVRYGGWRRLSKRRACILARRLALRLTATASLFAHFLASEFQWKRVRALAGICLIDSQ